ncbi:hypothetical protein BD779DRAFT_1493488 [Infundibulicybe gibba]|nr:hypothetical protein BD779DRAFT_1493488 [Infundibulicybe gibba]
MSAYYTQPAAANYNSPSSHSQKQRGYRICDQCGAAENPSVSKFRLCGGCSQDCQKTHWPSHKPICQHTANQISGAKQHSLSAFPDENIAKNLRQFTSDQRRSLRVPSNVRQSALLVELSYRNHPEPRRRFSVASTHIVPRSYIPDPLVAAEIKRREERCRHNGGIGTLVIIIQCGGVSQVMPVEVDPPSRISWDTREDWAKVLHHFVESGRTDFKPISTSSRGVYYG